eukprot:7012418-Pyramimonas_sp.AAC.1
MAVHDFQLPAKGGEEQGWDQARGVWWGRGDTPDGMRAHRARPTRCPERTVLVPLDALEAYAYKYSHDLAERHKTGKSASTHLWH